MKFIAGDAVTEDVTAGGRIPSVDLRKIMKSCCGNGKKYLQYSYRSIAVAILLLCR